MDVECESAGDAVDHRRRFWPAVGEAFPLGVAPVEIELGAARRS